MRCSGDPPPLRPRPTSRRVALSAIGSSPAHLAVPRSPVASADFAPVWSSWLSCSRFSPDRFPCILPPPACVQKNETHPQKISGLLNHVQWVNTPCWQVAYQQGSPYSRNTILVTLFRFQR